jgi:hypothetical protein
MRFITLFGIALVALATIGAVRADTFYWSGYGSYPGSFDGYDVMGYSATGSGHYGVYSTPDGVRGGWSTRGSSGSFGYAYDTNLRTAGNQGGFTTIGVHSSAVRGSYVTGWQGSYGGFAFGSGGVNYQPYTVGGWGGSRWTGYPASIPYASNTNSYGYYRNTWY